MAHHVEFDSTAVTSDGDEGSRGQTLIARSVVDAAALHREGPMATFCAIAALVAFAVSAMMAERPRGRTTRPFRSWLDQLP